MSVSHLEGSSPILLGIALFIGFTVVPASASSQALGIRHPALDHGIDKSKAAVYEKAVERVMAMDEEMMLSYMPDYAYANYCECPNCYGGVEGNGVLTWTLDRPEELKCRFCGTVVYPNEKYSESQVLTGKNKLGEEIRFPYYHNKERDIPHFLSTHLLMYKRAWLEAQCIALGKAYQTTGKEEYARRVVLVLDRIGQRYPHYPVMQNLSRKFLFRESQDLPYVWDSGKWNYFHNEIPKNLIAGYDMVCESKEFEKLSEKRGYDVREKFENDFLRKTFDVIAASPYHISNVVGYDIAGAALLGRVINEPGYVHRAFGWMKQNVDEGFLFDGVWHEGTPSYHAMTVGGIKSAFGTVQGYSDPPGYVDPVDGTRFDNLDPEKQVPFWGKCINAPSVMDLPNGWSSCIHDTHPHERRSQPRSTTVSTILPGLGHASLGRGSEGNQMQAQLHFSGGYGHQHYDNLNLTLWAKEREMLPDLGYTWTQMRYWTTCTLAHNLVVVDRKDQSSGSSDGDLIWFFPDSGGVSVVEADGKRGYRNVKDVDLYRRLLVTIPVSEADAYVVDLFRVRGGSTHDWVLHGDADEDTTASCSLPLDERRETMLEPGEKWVEPTIEGATFNPYGMLRELQKAEAPGGFQVTFAYTKEPKRGLRAHLLPPGPSQVWLGKSPSVRRMGYGPNADMRKAYDFWMPQLLVRRTGPSPLSSCFAAVEEPYRDKPFIDSVTPLKVTPEDSSVVALQVRHGDTVDTVIQTLDEPPYPERVTADGFRLKGRLAIVRRQGGKVTGAWLFEGESLLGGGLQLKATTSRYTGDITAATRIADGATQDAFVTDAALPIGTTLHGVWMIVTHASGHKHGYEIDRVEKRDGKTVIVLTSEHGLKIEGDATKEIYFPRRTFKGKNTFVIAVATSVTK